MSQGSMKPRVIDGGMHVDARGSVSFVNDFNLQGVDRFYFIRAHRAGEPRGWVGHRREQKWFHVVQGAVQIAIVQPDDWAQPSAELPVERHVLSADKPQILHVPAGYSTGSVQLTDDAILMVLSTGLIQNAKDDDYRFPVDQWMIQAD